MGMYVQPQQAGSSSKGKWTADYAADMYTHLIAAAIANCRHSDVV